MEQTIKKNDRGEEVVDIQRRLIALGFDLGKSAADGVFGEQTEMAVKAFQQKRGLTVDGVVGEETWQELVEASYQLGDRALYYRYPPLRGDDVRELQMSLNSLGFHTQDEAGVFEQETDRAVREFQRNVGLPPDGIAGEETIDALSSLKKAVSTGSRFAVPDKRYICNSCRGDRRSKIMLDPGHGLPEDPGAVGAFGLTEAEVCWRIALGCRRILEQRGVEVVFSREEGQAIPEGERSRRANQEEVDLLLSIHLNFSRDVQAEGSTCFYFSNGRWYSKVGKKAAHLIQDELVGSLGLVDCRVHGMNYTILRKTRMTAVQVEPAFISNVKEERLLGSGSYIETISRAISQGVARFLEMEKQSII